MIRPPNHTRFQNACGVLASIVAAAVILLIMTDTTTLSSPEWWAQLDEFVGIISGMVVLFFWVRALVRASRRIDQIFTQELDRGR